MDGRPNCKNKGVFSNSHDTVWTVFWERKNLLWSESTYSVEDARHSWRNFLVNFFSAAEARVRARWSFRKMHTLLTLRSKLNLEL